MDPMTTYQKHLSDHAPLKITISIRPKPKTSSKPIPKDIFDLPEFSKALDSILEVVNLDAFIPPERLEEHKHIIRVAAKICQEAQQTLKPFGNYAQHCLYSAAARAVHFNDLNLARFLLRRQSHATSILKVMNGTVQLVDAVSFGSKMDELKTAKIQRDRDYIDREFADLPDTTSNKKKGSNHQKMIRLAKLWVPIARTLRLSGVFLPCGTIVRGKPAQDSLYEQWAPTFSEKSN